MGDKTKWETTTTIIDDQICRRLRPAYKNNLFQICQKYEKTNGMISQVKEILICLSNHALNQIQLCDICLQFLE